MSRKRKKRVTNALLLSFLNLFKQQKNTVITVRLCYALDQSKDKRINEYQNPKLKLILEPVTFDCSDTILYNKEVQALGLLVSVS